MTKADSAEIPRMKITEDLWAARTTQILATATELDVFTHIARGKTSAVGIARAAGAKRRGMERLLDALVALGYLKKRSGDYGLEPVSKEYLVRGNATYLGAMIDMTLRESWDGLTDVVRTGRPQHAVDLEAEARDFFPHLVRAIFPMSLDTARAALIRLPQKTIAGIGTILDVAAGSAAWSIPFAQQIAAARGQADTWRRGCWPANAHRVCHRRVRHRAHSARRNAYAVNSANPLEAGPAEHQQRHLDRASSAHALTSGLPWISSDLTAFESGRGPLGNRAAL